MTDIVDIIGGGAVALEINVDTIIETTHSGFLHSAAIMEACRAKGLHPYREGVDWTRVALAVSDEIREAVESELSGACFFCDDRGFLTGIPGGTQRCDSCEKFPGDDEARAAAAEAS